MNDCVFCRIVSGEIPAEVIARSSSSPRASTVDRTVTIEDAILIRDRSPLAKEHLLVVAEGHVESLADDTYGYAAYGILKLAKRYAAEHLPGGFRIVFNTGEHAGQTVKHLHAHILGGEPLAEMGGRRTIEP